MPDVEALGRELGVRYLLEGNVRRTGAQLRVTVQLVEADGGEILWSRKFDRPLAELAALQEELIEELAAHLGTQFFRAEMEQALKKPGDLTAWECTMRAMAAVRQFTGESLFRGIEEASRAVAIAPDYGLAHAILANTSALTYTYLSPDDPAEVARIRHHIDRALACDGENAAVLGNVADALCFTGQAAEGLRRAKRAIAISPGYGYAHLVAGMACVMLDKPEAALAHLADFSRIEPHSPYQHYAYAWHAGAYMQLGDWAAADAAYDACLTVNPDANYAFCQNAGIARRLGRSDEAHQLMLEGRRREPEATLAMWELRNTRWQGNAAVLGELLTHIRALWVETDGLA
jgi:tetratricopeptide (TPR) repeat protein